MISQLVLLRHSILRYQNECRDENRFYRRNRPQNRERRVIRRKSRNQPYVSGHPEAEEYQMEVDELHASGPSRNRESNAVTRRPVFILFGCVLDQSANVALDDGRRPRPATARPVLCFADFVGQWLSRRPIRNCELNCVPQLGEPFEKIIGIEPCTLVTR